MQGITIKEVFALLGMCDFCYSLSFENIVGTVIVNSKVILNTDCLIVLNLKNLLLYL